MKDTHLSENQEDKLVSLRTLQEYLYTTVWSPLTNYLSKCEWLLADASYLLIVLSIVLTDAMSEIMTKGWRVMSNNNFVLSKS